MRAALLYVFFMCVLGGCSGSGGSGCSGACVGTVSSNIIGAASSTTATAAPAVTATPGVLLLTQAPPTPTVTAGGYFIGGMVGEVCEPKNGEASGQGYWAPTEELCVHAAPGAGVGVVSYSPTVTYQNVPASDGSGDTFSSRVQRLSGVTYQTDVTNNDTGGFGSVTFAMNSYTASQLYAQESQPVIPAHTFYYGAFVRPGPEPYGIYAPGTTTVDPQKTQDIVDAGVQMSRTPISTFFDDATGIGGGYSFAYDDPAIAWILAHNIVPLFELDAGPKLYGTYANNASQPLMHNPMEYGNFCTAAAQHLHAAYPSLGTKVPAYFTTPINEPNTATGWDASRTDNPSLYAEAASGPALYMQACYASIKAVFPTAKIYGGELATDTNVAPTSMPNEIARWYAAGCRIGTCFDGVALHISPIGNPLRKYTRCYEKNDGWTFACLTEMQAVSTSYGDPTLHAMITETDMASQPNSVTSAGDEPGQAWWESKTLAAAAANPAIDAIFWANINDDQLYRNTIFYSTSLVDTSGSAYRRKASFYTYCRFAKFPLPCVDPIVPAPSARTR